MLDIDKGFTPNDYLHNDYEEDEIEAVIDMMNKKFPPGVVLKTKFEYGCYCLFRVIEYIHDKRRNTIAAIGSGIDANGDVRLNCQFGLHKVEIIPATQSEIKYLEIKLYLDSL